MKTLPIQFTESGWTHNQILREGQFAIYERQKKDSPASHYEVIRIRSHNGYTIGDKFIEPSEIYPSEKKFGVDGFSCHSLARAKERLLELMEYSDSGLVPSNA